MAAQSEIETCFNYCDSEAFFSSNERKWVNNIRKLATQYPNECVILQQPETNGGFIYAKVPTSWLRVRPPRKVEMTEERRIAAAERLQKAREQRNR